MALTGITPHGDTNSPSPKKGATSGSAPATKRTEGMPLTGITPHADTNSPFPKKGASSASAPATKKSDEISRAQGR